eukprot:681225-Pyramimonas_sp.AAC.1
MRREEKDEEEEEEEKDEEEGSSGKTVKTHRTNWSSREVWGDLGGAVSARGAVPCPLGSWGTLADIVA